MFFDMLIGNIVIKKGLFKRKFFFHPNMDIDNSLFVLKCYVTQTALGKRVRVVFIPEEELVVKKISIFVEQKSEKGDRIFINGFSSNFKSYETSLSNLERSNFGRFLDFFNFRKKGSSDNCSTTFTYKKIGESILFFGSVSEEFGFSKFLWEEKGVRVEKDCSDIRFKYACTIFDFVIYDGAIDSVAGSYFSLMPAVHNRVYLPKYPISCWVSEKLSSNVLDGGTALLRSVEALSQKSVHTDFFIVNSGWEKELGDWFAAKGSLKELFSNITTEISKRGMKSVLSFSPFVVSYGSKIFRTKTDWLLVDKKDRLISVYCEKYKQKVYLLNIYNPEVVKHLEKLFDVIFSLWKFDAVYLENIDIFRENYFKAIPNGGVLNFGLKLLNRLAGENLVFVNDSPVSALFGVADVGVISSYSGKIWSYNKSKSNRVESYVDDIKNLVTENFIDTNGFLVASHILDFGDKSIEFSKSDVASKNKNNSEKIIEVLNKGVVGALRQSQGFTLCKIKNILSSVLIFSGNIDGFDNDVLNFYKKQFPMREKKIEKLDLENGILKIKFFIGQIEYSFIANLSSEQFVVDVDFQNQYYYHCEKDEFLKRGDKVDLNAFNSMTLVHISNREYAPAGSTTHIFACSEVIHLIAKGEELEYKIDDKNKLPGFLYIKVSKKYDIYTVNGLKCNRKVFQGLNYIKIPIS